MQEKKQLPGWLLPVLFPVVLVYYEFIFRVSTVQGFPLTGTLFMLAFSAAYGLVGYLLATLFRNKRVNFAITLVWLILTVAPYLIEYFIYRQFNLFYDLSTCLNGATDALTNYVRELCLLIFCWHGLSRIFLFLLPTALFIIFGRHRAVPQQLRMIPRLLVAAVMVVMYLLASFGIAKSPTLSLLCGKEYNFQTVVGNLGLMTGLRLDVGEYFSAEEPDGFEVTPTVPSVLNPADGEDSTAPTEEAPVVYSPNVMELDFDAVPNKGTLPQVNAYVSSLTPSMQNKYTGLFKGKNLILITAEAFTAEVIDPELTPTLYRLATKGIQFTDYYQPNSCGTTGGEFQVMLGMPPAKGGSSFRTTVGNLNYFTLGSQLDRLGYYGVAYHNHTHTYYDRNLTHNNLGYSEGFVADGTGLEDHLSNLWPKSDTEMFRATVPTYIDKQPFNVYYMTYSGHSVYTKDGNAFTRMHWDRVKDLDYSDTVKGYLAAQLEFEDALTYLIEELEAAGIADDTVICISSDHFPYGLDYGSWSSSNSNLAELYGYTPTNYVERDHNRLILWCGILEDMEPIVVDTPTCSVDILPTLSNLFGTEYDSRLMVGRDVFSDAMPLMFNVFHDWKTEYGTYIASEYTFYPADPSIEIPEGYVDAVRAIVRNKILFSKWLLETDYYSYLFPAE